MKEMYTKPACEVTEFEAVDVLTTVSDPTTTTHIDQIGGEDDD